MTQIEIINGCQSYAKMYGSCKASEKHYIPIEGLQANQKLFYIVSYWLLSQKPEKSLFIHFLFLQASEGDKAIDAIQQGERMKERMDAAGKGQQFECVL